MTEQGKMTDAEIVESYIPDLRRKTVMSKDMERLTEALEDHAIGTNDFDVIVAESIAEGVLESAWLAEHDAKVRAEERERCAQIAENLYFGGGSTGSANRWGAKQAAARIREQGS